MADKPPKRNRDGLKIKNIYQNGNCKSVKMAPFYIGLLLLLTGCRRSVDIWAK